MEDIANRAMKSWGKTSHTPVLSMCTAEYKNYDSLLQGKTQCDNQIQKFGRSSSTDIIKNVHAYCI